MVLDNKQRFRKDLYQYSGKINGLLARYGVKFGIYKNGKFKEQLFPFDPIPRVIGKKEFDFLERGLKQRVMALNLFLRDIYSKKNILTDSVIPEEFVYAGKGFLSQCDGVASPKGIWPHIAGIDLVKGRDGSWYILEDNLRIPSGASYPMIARSLCRKASPRIFEETSVSDNRDYAAILRHVMEYVNTGGLNMILTPGRYNAAYFEHSYLAEKMGVHLTDGTDLFVERDNLYFRDYKGRKERVGALYRRISDEYLDPMNFNPQSVIGVPHIFDVYRKGNLALINAPGNGVADDKGIYYFVPKMVKYYLGEENILQNAKTYLPYFEADRKYVLEHFRTLVIKDVAEAGGYGVFFGKDMSEEMTEKFKYYLETDPRRFIAQEVIDFEDLELYEKGNETSVSKEAESLNVWGNWGAQNIGPGGQGTQNIGPGGQGTQNIGPEGQGAQTHRDVYSGTDVAEEDYYAENKTEKPEGYSEVRMQELDHYAVSQSKKQKGRVLRKADLRAFVLTAEEPVVWKSGLTRFTRDAESFVVNSSQGGGFKDTWVLKES